MKDYSFLTQEAFNALENAYAPYSKYRVGSCILMKDGTLVHGANIENASFGATSCAERNAIFAAYSTGYRKEDVEAIAIVTEGDILAGPCGICRQVLSELIPSDVPVLLSNHHEHLETTMNDLLPLQFGPKDVL